MNSNQQPMPSTLRQRGSKSKTRLSAPHNVKKYVWLSILVVFISGAVGSAAVANSNPDVQRQIVQQSVCGTWKVTTGPKLGYNPLHTFSGVAAVTGDDVWVVGSKLGLFGWTKNEPLSRHWDGAKWQEFAIPGAGGGRNTYLTKVVARSTNDVWAVGASNDDGRAHRTFVTRWNGNKWNVVDSPNPGQYSNGISSVAAIAADDVWVVGDYEDKISNPQPLLLHWDGHGWRSDTSFKLRGSSGDIRDVLAFASNDVWAVGGYFHNGKAYSLVIHWDGSQWSEVAIPGEGDGIGLQVLAGSSAQDLWIAGYRGKGEALMHWNGVSWNVPAQPAGTSNNVIYGIEVTSEKDAWAVGPELDSNNNIHPKILHWDGNQWTQVFSLQQEGEQAFYEIVVDKNKDVWAVGRSYDAESHISYGLTALLKSSSCSVGVNSTIRGDR